MSAHVHEGVAKFIFFVTFLFSFGYTLRGFDFSQLNLGDNVNVILLATLFSMLAGVLASLFAQAFVAPAEFIITVFLKFNKSALAPPNPRFFWRALTGIVAGVSLYTALLWANATVWTREPGVFFLDFMSLALLFFVAIVTVGYLWVPCTRCMAGEMLSVAAIVGIFAMVICLFLRASLLVLTSDACAPAYIAGTTFVAFLITLWFATMMNTSSTHCKRHAGSYYK